MHISPISAQVRQGFCPCKITLSYMGKNVFQINNFQMGENKSINSFIHKGNGYLTLGRENFYPLEEISISYMNTHNGLIPIFS